MSGLIKLLSDIGIGRDIVVAAVFYPIAALTLVLAFMVVVSRRIFHSAVYLAFTLIGVACIYLFLNAEFLAIVQVLIYVGAIVTLFIFTIMLTKESDIPETKPHIWRLLVSLAVTLGALFILARTLLPVDWPANLRGPAVITLPQLGRSLMTTYVLPFEVISLVSLAALVGAIVIGKGKKR